MKVLVIVLVIVVMLLLIVAAMSVQVVRQYEQGVLFRLGKMPGARTPELQIIVPFIDVLHRVSSACPPRRLRPGRPSWSQPSTELPLTGRPSPGRRPSPASA